MGEQVARLGKSYFRSKFCKKSMQSEQTAEDKAKYGRLRNTPKWRHFLYIALLAGLLVAGVIIAPIIIPVTVFIVAMYFGSLGFAVLRYNRWLSKCLSRYHASQHRVSQPAPTPAVYQPAVLSRNTILFQTYEEVASTHRLLNTIENFALDGIPLATTMYRFKFKLAEKTLTMLAEVWNGRIHTVIFSNDNGEDIDDDEAEKLLKANSGGVIWSTDKAQPQYLFRSDNKAFASYENGRKSLHLVGRELLSARAQARRT